jgi:hypothetical protein
MLSKERHQTAKGPIRSVVVGGLAILGCLIWYDDILKWDNGKGPVVLATCFIGFPRQALFYGLKWLKD